MKVILIVSVPIIVIIKDLWSFQSLNHNLQTVNEQYKIVYD